MPYPFQGACIRDAAATYSSYGMNPTLQRVQGHVNLNYAVPVIILFNESILRFSSTPPVVYRLAHA